MTTLDSWLQQATRHLSKGAVAQVGTEIREHYESAREAAINSGVAAAEADQLAVRDLGDARAANCQYRKVLLTSAEARTLRQGTMEARAVCSRPWLRWLLSAIPVAVLLRAAAASFITGTTALAWDLVVVGTGMGILFMAPFLPVYTPVRGRIFRAVKWVVMLSTLALMLPWTWLVIACLWPFVWTELTRASIRRKLPVADWPKHLYL